MSVLLKIRPLLLERLHLSSADMHSAMAVISILMQFYDNRAAGITLVSWASRLNESVIELFLCIDQIQILSTLCHVTSVTRRFSHATQGFFDRSRSCPGQLCRASTTKFFQIFSPSQSFHYIQLLIQNGMFEAPPYA